MGEIADALGHRRENRRITRHGKPRDFKSKIITLMLGGAGLVLLIVLIAIFLKDSNELPTEDLPSIQARLSQLEKRISHLEGMEERIVFLDKQEKALQRYIVEYDQSGGPAAQRLHTLAERVDHLEKIVATVTVETKRKPFPLSKGRYHEVRWGDTLYQIAQRYGTSVDELCRLNNITPSQVIYPGQKVLVTSEDNQ